MSDTTLPDGRVMPAEDYARRLALLSKDFPKEQIEKLPKQLKRGDQAKWQCRQGTQASADGYYCGGYHARSIHLDYIGHATITERLNEVDPQWTIEFMVTNPETHAPLVDAEGTWFNMTVLGVTRPCVGDAGGKGLTANGRKELIGDAIRNGAMRFGVGTYLWSKSEEAERRKRGELGEGDPEPAAPPAAPNWAEQYQAAMERGPDTFRNFLQWAKTHGGPPEMIKKGEETLAQRTTQAVEGEVITDED